MTRQTTILTNFDSVNPSNIIGSSYTAASASTLMGAGQYVVENGKLYVHGDGLGYTQSKDFVSMDLAVQANTTYTLSFNAASWSKLGVMAYAASLGVYVNGTQINPDRYLALPPNGSESTFSLSFTTGADTHSVHLGIRDVVPDYGHPSDLGNSFTFDNLTLSWNQPNLAPAPVPAPAPAPARNWIVNGDFENGATGFNTGYRLLSQVAGAGTEAVVTAPPAGWGMGGNSGYGGSGKFLMVDGAASRPPMGVSSPTVWSQKVTGLEANTDYDFSFMMMTNRNASTLAIKSNGIQVGTTSMQDSLNWTLNQKTVTSNSKGELTLSLATTGHYEAAYNDFGLDHISLVKHAVL